MNEIVTDLIDLIEALEQTDKFKDLSDAEVRSLAIDLLKIEEVQKTGNGISNAISYINYDTQ